MKMNWSKIPFDQLNVSMLVFMRISQKKMIEQQNSILQLFLKDREAGEKISQHSVNYCFSF